MSLPPPAPLPTGELTQAPPTTSKLPNPDLNSLLFPSLPPPGGTWIWGKDDKAESLCSLSWGGPQVREACHPSFKADLKILTE